MLFAVSLLLHDANGMSVPATRRAWTGGRAGALVQPATGATQRAAAGDDPNKLLDHNQTTAPASRVRTCLHCSLESPAAASPLPCFPQRAVAAGGSTAAAGQSWMEDGSLPPSAAATRASTPTPMTVSCCPCRTLRPSPMACKRAMCSACLPPSCASPSLLER
jgi:hypothetical protein